MEANQRQVGGEHYRSPLQHWDWVAQNQLDYFQGQITKYVSRWRDKGGLQDLEKARHFLDKYIELVRSGVYKPLGTSLRKEDWARQATLAEISNAALTRAQDDGVNYESNREG